MVEILMAVMVLAVGLIMLFPAFSVGLAQSRQSTESMLMSQLGPNAEAYIRAMINPRTDANFTATHTACYTGCGGNPFNGNIHVYRFVTTPGGTPAGALPGFTWWRHKTDGSIATAPPTNESNYERINPRIYGDPYTSKYYWNLLYRGSSSSLIEFWIMVCKRIDTDQDNPSTTPVSIVVPRTLPGVTNLGWSTHGVRTGELAVAAVPYIEPGTAVVTNNGEILQIVSKQSRIVAFDHPLLRPTVANLWFCPTTPLTVTQGPATIPAGDGNACIGAFYFRLSN